MCFGMSRGEAYDCPPPRGIYTCSDAFIQYRIDRDNESSKEKMRRRKRKYGYSPGSTALRGGAMGPGPIGGGGGGGGGGGCDGGGATTSSGCG